MISKQITRGNKNTPNQSSDKTLNFIYTYLIHIIQYRSKLTQIGHWRQNNSQIRNKNNIPNCKADYKIRRKLSNSVHSSFSFLSGYFFSFILSAAGFSNTLSCPASTLSWQNMNTIVQQELILEKTWICCGFPTFNLGPTFSQLTDNCQGKQWQSHKLLCLILSKRHLNLLQWNKSWHSLLR